MQDVIVPYRYPNPIEYRPISGFPNYRVGNDGSVWSKAKKGPRTRTDSEWSLKAPHPHRGGYHQVSLHRDGKCFNFSVQRLVLEAFVRPCPDGCEACHSPDNCKTNNNLVNLRWDTKTENAKDREAHGTSPVGQRNPNSKLSEELAKALLDEYRKGGVTQQELADRHGLHRKTIGRLNTGENWNFLHSADVPRNDLY